VIDLKITLKGYYEGKVEFYRDEIDVRVESLKGELDKIRDSLHQKLDEAKEKTFKYF
jgi:50S ribosomal subunit-associated GTPase HflX